MQELQDIVETPFNLRKKFLSVKLLEVFCKEMKG